MENNYQSDEYLVLNSAGVTYVDWNAWILREKGRLDYQIIYIYQGQILAEVDGIERIIPEGNVILYRPHEKQKYSFFADHPTLHCWFHFSGAGCDEILAQAGFGEGSVLPIGKNKQLVDIIQKLETEGRLQKEGYKLLCRGYLLEFFALFMRTKHYRNDPAALRNMMMIENICTVIHQELDKTHSLTFFADHCHLSVSRFSHVFKDVMGVSPREYINNAKLEKAALLLVSTYLRISEIAQKTGYHDQNHFTKVFKQKTGWTPTQYRIRGQNGDAELL